MKHTKKAKAAKKTATRKVAAKKSPSVRAKKAKAVATASTRKTDTAEERAALVVKTRDYNRKHGVPTVREARAAARAARGLPPSPSMGTKALLAEFGGGDPVAPKRARKASAGKGKGKRAKAAAEPVPVADEVVADEATV